MKIPATLPNSNNWRGVVHAEGLEPTHLTAPDPKSGAATNYATRAERILKKDCKGNEIIGIKQLEQLG